jgi:hypothetical protein
VSKPDHLADMVKAVAQLRDVLANMGHGHRVLSIEIDDDADGHSFDACIRSSPSYVHMIEEEYGRPSDRPCGGVKIKVKKR